MAAVFIVCLSGMKLDSAVLLLAVNTHTIKLEFPLFAFVGSQIRCVLKIACLRLQKVLEFHY